MSEYEKAYWISPAGQYKGFTYTTHIQEVITAPQAFGYTEKKLRQCFAKYQEPYGLEGLAREKIIKKLIKKGWIRVRLYEIPVHYWTININKLNLRTLDFLHEFAFKLYNDFGLGADELRIDRTGKELIYLSVKEVYNLKLYDLMKAEYPYNRKKYKLELVKEFSNR